MIQIRRGTTPTMHFALPIDVSLIKEVRITYAQNDRELYVKTTEDCTMEGKTISHTLTQEETFRLDSASRAQVQLRLLTAGGVVPPIEIEPIKVLPSIDEEVLA